MSFKDWDEDRVRQHNEEVRRKRFGKSNGSSEIAKNESIRDDAAEEQDHAPKPLPQVVIRFTHYVRRLADSDAYIGKWWTDGIVEAGILFDDSPEYVQETRHRQVKIEQWQEEKTIIELIEATA